MDFGIGGGPTHCQKPFSEMHMLVPGSRVGGPAHSHSHTCCWRCATEGRCPVPQRPTGTTCGRSGEQSWGQPPFQSGGHAAWAHGIALRAMVRPCSCMHGSAPAGQALGKAGDRLLGLRRAVQQLLAHLQLVERTKHLGTRVNDKAERSRLWSVGRGLWSDQPDCRHGKLHAPLP